MTSPLNERFSLYRKVSSILEIGSNRRTEILTDHGKVVDRRKKTVSNTYLCQRRKPRNSSVCKDTSGKQKEEWFVLLVFVSRNQWYMLCNQILNLLLFLSQVFHSPGLWENVSCNQTKPSDHKLRNFLSLKLYSKYY